MNVVNNLVTLLTQFLNSEDESYQDSDAIYLITSLYEYMLINKDKSNYFIRDLKIILNKYKGLGYINYEIWQSIMVLLDLLKNELNNPTKGDKNETITN